MRPRLLDFGVSAASGAIGTRVLANLRWPADAFRVTFPSRPDADSETNAFERLFLKLLLCGASRSIEGLLEASCFPHDPDPKEKEKDLTDLVRTIVQQLQDKGYIDNALRPDQEALRGLGLDIGEETQTKEDPTTFGTALVFRDCFSGRLLPYIHILSDSAQLRRGNGGNDDIDLSRYVPKNRPEPPNPEEIRALLRAVRLGRRLSGNAIPRIDAGLVNVDAKPERVLLPCQLFFEHGSGRQLVSDPFVDGCSAVLGSSLQELRRTNQEVNKAISNLEETMVPVRPNVRSKAIENVSPETRQRYPRLADSLRTSEDAPTFSANKVYGVLEWAFFYACSKSPVEPALALLEDGFRTDELPAIQAKAASKAGFVCQDALGKPIPFPPVRPGKALDYRNGKAEMNTLVAIALLQYSIDPDRACIRGVSRSFPDFFRTLAELRKERNEQQHGKKRGARKGHSPFLSRILPVVNVLLPDAEIKLEGALKPSRIQEDSVISIRLHLQKMFGFNLFSRLTETEVGNLVSAERNANRSGANADRQPFATGVCNVLESLLESRLRSDEFQRSLHSIPFDEALSSRIEMFDLSPLQDHPSYRLNARNQASAANGNPKSLGACVKCLVAWEDEGSLRLLLGQHPRFVEDIGELLELRGHGNERLTLDRDQIETFRDTSFSLIKTILETLP